MTEAVFDTNILIDALRGVPAAHGELKRYSERFISRMSWIEIMVLGLPGDADRAEGFLSQFRIIEVGEDIARHAATLRGQRRRLGALDAIVLASAQKTGRILVTRNTTDFPATMPGIRIPYFL